MPLKKVPASILWSAFPDRIKMTFMAWHPDSDFNTNAFEDGKVNPGQGQHRNQLSLPRTVFASYARLNLSGTENKMSTQNFLMFVQKQKKFSSVFVHLYFYPRGMISSLQWDSRMVYIPFQTQITEFETYISNSITA